VFRALGKLKESGSEKPTRTEEHVQPKSVKTKSNNKKTEATNKTEAQKLNQAKKKSRRKRHQHKSLLQVQNHIFFWIKGYCFVLSIAVAYSSWCIRECCSTCWLGEYLARSSAVIKSSEV